MLRNVTLAIFFVACTAPRAGADGVSLPALLTMDDAVHLFRVHGFDLLLAEAATDSARADELIAGAIPNPWVNASVGKTFGYNPSPADCPGCSDVSWGVGVGDQGGIFDTLWGKRHLRRQVAAAAYQAARMVRADAQRTLEFQVKQQYITAVLARDTLDFAKEVQAGATKIFELNQVRYNAGAISEADVAKVETAKLEADQDVDRAEQDLRTAKVAIAFLVGVRGATPDFQVAPDLPRFAVPQALTTATRASLLQAAVEHRADLKGIAFQEQRATISIRSARRLLLPDTQLSLNFNAEGRGTNALQPPTLTFGVGLPIPLLYRYEGEITKAEADLRTQSLTHSKLEAQVAADVETGYVAFTQTRRRVERMEARLLDRSRRARDLIEVQYQKGAASLLEFLDAQRTFISTTVEYLKTLADYWTAVFLLEEAVGMELRS